jgi:hypothetical protein
MLVDIVFVEFESRSLRLNLIPESPAGFYQVIWDARDASSGIYFYRIQAEEYSETKKMLLLK